MKNTITIICLALAMALGIGGNALADEYDKTGPYLGTGFGYTTLSGEGPDDTLWAPSVFAGYMLHRNLGVEGGINWFSFKVGNPNGAELETKYNSLYLAAIGRFHIADNFAIYGKGGFHRWEVDIKNLCLPVNASVVNCGEGGEDSIDGFFGAGAQVDLSDEVSARLEYVRYLTDEGTIDGEADIIGVHLLYRF